jgi:FdhE protein
MPINFALTSDQVKKSVETVINNKPAYSDLLGFYGRLFVAQEESNSRLRIEPLGIPDDVRAVKAREKFPLIEIQDFAYDKVESANLFVTLCNLAKEASPRLAPDAAAILKTIDKVIKPGQLFSGLLNGDDTMYEKIAGKLNIADTSLGFIAYNSLKPSLSVCADQLSTFLSKEEPWLKGYCPICGSPPALSILEGSGGRSLICSFCWHSWSVQRVFCPYCENRDGQTQHYFYNEGEKEFRVDLCDSCKKYLKALDSRETERMIYAPLEQISSLHLDYKAKEMGYASGMRLAIAV